MDVARDLTARGIHDIADLEIAVPRRQKGGLLGQTPVRSHHIREHLPVGVDRLDHATTPIASSRSSTLVNARRRSSFSSKNVRALSLYAASFAPSSCSACGISGAESTATPHRSSSSSAATDAARLTITGKPARM